MFGELFKKTKNIVLGATKGSFKELITAELNKSGYSFHILSDDLIVMYFSSADIRYELYLFFGEESKGFQQLQLRCITLASFQHNEIKGKKLVNELNDTFRWVYFFIGQKGELTASLDFELTRNNTSILFLPILQIVMTAINAAYPIIMKARWTEELQESHTATEELQDANAEMEDNIPYQ